MLGVGPADVLLLTVASGFKYACPGQQGFLEVVLPVLEAMPQVRLLAIGPEPVAEWSDADHCSGGRIRALGTRIDTEAFYSAADIYLDSLPFSSITSLLEAGSRGLPLLAYVPNETELALLGPGAPGLDGVAFLERSIPSYRQRLAELVSDPRFRHSVGDVTREQIFQHHMPANWLIKLETVYERCAACDNTSCLDQGASDAPKLDPLNTILYRLYGQTRDRHFMARLIAGSSRSRTDFRRLLLTFRFCRAGLMAPACMSLMPRFAGKVFRRLAARAESSRGRLKKRPDLQWSSHD